MSLGWSLKMRFTFTILLLLILGLSISCGPEFETPTKENRTAIPDLNVIRMNGGCTDQRFLDAELAAYQALLEARAEAARVLDQEITAIEKAYKDKLSQLNLNYVRELNKCGNNSTCTATAKSDYDKWVGREQVYHDEALYVAQGKELAAKEQAQQDYEAAVTEAREKFCRRGYTASGQDGPVVYSGKICDLERPFSITGTHPIFTFPFEFQPSSPTAGTASYKTSSSGISAQGNGTYTIVGLDTDTPRILWQSQSTATIPIITTSGGGTATINLTPLKNGEECS